MSDLASVLLKSGREEDSNEESDSSNRAAIYVRTSSPNQRLGYSIDEQVRQCVQRCQTLDWEIVFVFRDEAISGKDTDRPMFQQMLSKAERGFFDVLVFWKLDRFSRSIMHAVQLENQFNEWGVALHSVTEQLDTTSAAGRFNFRNIANAAEFERDLIQQRTKMGHLARAMEHKWPNSSPPLGYELQEDGTLSVLPDEGALVRLVFKEYLEKRSMPELSEWLNQTDRTNRGEYWTPSAVGVTLRNRLYIGEYSVGEVRETVGEYQILSEKLFETVTSVRTRFQATSSVSRDMMNQARKTKIIERQCTSYADFLD